MTYTDIIEAFATWSVKEGFSNLNSALADCGTSYGGVTYGPSSVGTIEEVQTWGGSGEGESIGRVIFFPDHNVYIQVGGYYDSWNGSDYENGYHRQVYPSIEVKKTYNIFPLKVEDIIELNDKLHKYVREIQS